MLLSRGQSENLMPDGDTCTGLHVPALPYRGNVLGDKG